VTSPWKPDPKGTQAELRAIARFINPDALPKEAVRLEAHLRAIAIYLLLCLHADDKRGMREERERYQDIAKLARQLEEKLAAVASRGRLLSPLGARRTQPPKGSGSNYDVAYAICSKWETYPLFLLRQTAKKVADSLPGGRGKGTLQARVQGDPKGLFADACAKLLLDFKREPPKDSARGELADLMNRLWRFAVGADPPASIRSGSAARAAAHRLLGVNKRKRG
jgi:hypothetical protein